MEALVIDTEAWYEDANTNLRFLKRNVGQCITESTSYEKTMWEIIETELEEINVENLGFDYLICSGVLDIKSEPFTNMPRSVSDIFKEPFQRYNLEQNHDVMEACKEFIQNEESKINMDEVLGNINYGEWLDKSEELQDLTKRMLESIADYMMVAWLGKKAELEIVYLETGRPNSSQDKQVCDHKKLIRFSKDSIDTTRNIKNLKKIFNQLSTRQNLTIFTINIAESGIYKYCLIEETTILLHMTSPSAVYPLIHTLLTLITVVACTLHKILYSPDSGDISTPKNL
ncbi:hypothetical protein RhiirC2_761494 [Rhizophagus irregularis]|uniref:Uncharacterized protein n=1 Tax=Rhizophagus irregularis TaxID=588596 RepID=A0A2N1MGE5_9GLOM|nr:hypothetical protein RhiirC2_761494 [Rhizophagus irregularis]